jgi:hypothetical protein
VYLTQVAPERSSSLVLLPRQVFPAAFARKYLMVETKLLSYLPSV